MGGIGAGLLAAGGGVVACMGIAVLGWLTGSTGSMGNALHAGAGAWLLAHGYSLELGSATVSVVPLGLTAMLGLALAWCAGGAARICRAAHPRALAQVAAASATSYVAGVALVAAFSSVGVAPVRGTLVTLLLAAAAASAGAVRVLPVQPLPSLPLPVLPVLRGALGGAFTLFGCAALAVAVSLVTHLDSLRQVVGSLAPGPAGGLVLVVVCLAFLPNVVLLSTAVVLGPGTAVGVGTSVTLTEVFVAPLPAIPWLAAVPEAGTQPVALAALAALPVVAGIVAGVAAVRRLPAVGVATAAGSGLAAGVLAGILVGAGVCTAGGSMGPGRMAELGAPGLLSLAMAVGTLGVGGLLGGTSVWMLGRRGR